MKRRSIGMALFSACVLFLGACKGGGGSAPVAVSSSFSVGGVVSGLSGSVTLRNSAQGSSTNLTISGNGLFQFPAQVANGAGYAVTVVAQPVSPTQTCSVSKGTGTVSGADITNIDVVCATNTYSVSGTVNGLTGTGLVLQNNSQDDLLVVANQFIFPVKVADQAGYNVTVKTQPASPNQTCTVDNGTGAVNQADIANVSVACSTNTYSVGGTVSGLTGTGLVLWNNGGDDLAIGINGTITFTVKVADTAGYNVTIKTQPTGQTCTVASGTGSLSGSDITNVAVSCADNPFTVGGMVSGLTSTGLVLHSSNGDDAGTSGNGPFTFGLRFADAQPYIVTIKTQPAYDTCVISNGSGTIPGGNVTNIAVACNQPVPVYPHAANWNDYVKAADPSQLCTGSETGGYKACIHGGERRVLAVPGKTSCSGLSAVDGLNAFDWTCDASTGSALMLSTGLKPDKGLSDLIDFDIASFKPNSVTVSDNGIVTFTTSTTAWWTNPVAVNNNGGTLATAGTIYIVNPASPHTPIPTYIIAADKIGFLVRPGATARTSGNSVTSSYRKFLWIEGALNPYTYDYGIWLYPANFSMLRNITVSRAVTAGIYLNGSSNNVLMNLRLSNDSTGLSLYNCSYNAVANLQAGNNGSCGVDLQNSANNSFRNITTSNGNYGVSLSGSSNNIIIDITSGNNSSGLYGDFSSMNNVVMNAATPNYNWYNVYLYSGNTQTNIAYLNLASSFVGRVTTDDVKNTTDTNGRADYSNGNNYYIDWTNFDDDYRLWGREGTSFLSTDSQGNCTSMTYIWCRIYDWRLLSTDTVIKGVLPQPSGNDSITHAWSDATTVTFLKNAVELSGNGNGLCESGETCLYTPNIGAYQGHGNLVSAGSFTNGAVSGVTLLRHETNGY